MNTQKTLKDLIEAAKCRKGTAAGVTKRGAYWLACEPITIRRHGGDGIGNSAPDRTNCLELRHFRDGTARAVVHFSAFHQNGSWGGAGDSYADASAVLDCASAEEVIATLKGLGGEEGAAFGDSRAEGLTAALAALGLPAAMPAPDEVA